MDFSRVGELARSYYANVSVEESLGGRKRVLHEHADAGLLVWPKLDAAARCVKNPKKSWNLDRIVARYVLDVFQEVNPTFKNDANDNVGVRSQRLLKRTAKILAKLDKETQGDVHVQLFNAGARFAGYDTKSSRGHMAAFKNHLPATDLMGLCFALTDPEFFTNESLIMDLPGTEGRTPSLGNVFDCAPCLCVSDNRFEYRFTSAAGGRHSAYGSASVVLRAPMFVE